MDTSALKGLELLIIVGAVVWFYQSQMRNLKQLKEERETKGKAASEKQAGSDQQ